MNTRHGYHIDRTHLRKAENVKPCGGPAHCVDCMEDVAHENARQDLKGTK